MSEEGQTANVRAGRIEEDHRELRSRLDALTAAADQAGMLSSLQELPKLLAEHFADEEAEGGLYDELAARSPALGDRLDELRDEHRAILDELESLGRDLQRHPGTQGESGETVQQDIAHCADRLRRHERVESKMIADVYYSEQGGYG